MNAVVDEYRLLALSLIRGKLAAIEAEFVEFLKDVGLHDFWHAPFNPRLVYFPQPQAGAAIPVVAALWESAAAPGLVGFMPNLTDGWSNLVGHYCRRFKRECFTLSASSSDQQWPRNSFIYFRGDEIRHVASWKDSPGWQFYEKGEIQPFEDPDRYQKPRIHDRLTFATVLECARRFGADLRDDDFWVSARDALWFKQRRSTGLSR